MIWGSRPRAGVRARSRAGVVAASAVALFGAGCSSGAVQSAIEAPLPDYIGPCSEQYGDGDLIDYEDGTFSNACRDDAGELNVPVPVRLDCTDGPDLLYNDFAWGFEGDVMTVLPPADEERRPDQEVILECLSRDGAAADSDSGGDTDAGSGVGGEAEDEPADDADDEVVAEEPVTDDAVVGE